MSKDIKETRRQGWLTLLALLIIAFAVYLGFTPLFNLVKGGVAGGVIGSSFGAIFSVDLVESLDCFDVLNKMECVVSSSNLGDTRTLGIPVAHTIYFEMGNARRNSMGISDSMIRFSVGIEEIEDLLTDFEKALKS